MEWLYFNLCCNLVEYIIFNPTKAYLNKRKALATMMILHIDSRRAARQLHTCSLEFYDPAIADTKHLGE